jgi:alpha-tubulin suppressor-like RCC1 family protein
VSALDTLEAYDVVSLQAITRDANGNVLTGRVIRWTSSNPAIATVDSVTGALTGLDRGTVTVTATSEGKVGSASRVVVIKYRSITAGTMHACDIASGGIVWCWGLNGAQGRIGSSNLADASASSTPVRVPNTGPNGIRFTQLSTYGAATCGLAGDGKAWCWGSNNWGLLGNGSNAYQSSTPVAVSGSLTYKQISVGAEHVCAITTGGDLYCWGHNDSKQISGSLPSSIATPTQIAAGQSFQSVAASSAFTCAVTTAGAAYCIGASGLGQLGDGGKLSYGNTYLGTLNAVVGGIAFRSIDNGSQYTCALTPSGKAYCWGSDGGKLGDGPNGGDTSSPVAVAGGLTFGSIGVGGFHACGIATDASMWCWGANKDGQLGNAIANGATSPVRAGGSLLGAEISAAGIATGSGAHTCAIGADRLTTYCWGLNDIGQVGNGTATGPNTKGSPTPSIVVGQKPL